MTDQSELRDRFDLLPTHELVSMLRRRDSDEWRPEVFDVVREILAARGIFSVDEAGLVEPSIEPGAGEHDLVAPGEDAAVIATGLELQEAGDCDKVLRAEGIPAQVVPIPDGGFGVYVAKHLQPKAEQLLREAGLLPADDAPAPISDTGGACPACGAAVVPGAGECPECGLAV
jgi:hypothetical protein